MRTHACNHLECPGLDLERVLFPHGLTPSQLEFKLPKLFGVLDIFSFRPVVRVS